MEKNASGLTTHHEPLHTEELHCDDGQGHFFATCRYDGNDQAPERGAAVVITRMRQGSLRVRHALAHSALALQTLPTPRLEPAVT